MCWMNALGLLAWSLVSIPNRGGEKMYVSVRDRAGVATGQVWTWRATVRTRQNEAGTW